MAIPTRDKLGVAARHNIRRERLYPLTLASLGPGSRGSSLDSYLVRKIAEARRDLFATAPPQPAHALARLVWKRSKLQMLAMAREKGL